MTNEDLIKANDITKEIKELEAFIWTAEKVWTGKIIKKSCKYMFRSSACGMLGEAEYHMKTETKNKVLNVLRDHLQDLKNQLKSL